MTERNGCASPLLPSGTYSLSSSECTLNPYSRPDPLSLLAHREANTGKFGVPDAACSYWAPAQRSADPFSSSGGRLASAQPHTPFDAAMSSSCDFQTTAFSYTARRSGASARNSTAFPVRVLADFVRNILNGQLPKAHIAFEHLTSGANLRSVDIFQRCSGVNFFLTQSSSILRRPIS